MMQLKFDNKTIGLHPEDMVIKIFSKLETDMDKDSSFLVND